MLLQTTSASPRAGRLCGRTTVVPVARLRAALDALLHTFGCISQGLAQLEAAQLALPHFARLEVGGARRCGLAAQGGAASKGEEEEEEELLVLWFVDAAGAGAKLGVGLPLASLAGGCLAHTAPALRVRAVLPAAGGDARGAHAGAVLGRVPPGHQYLHHLCCAAAGLVGAGLPAAGSVDAAAAAGWAGAGSSTPMRMLDNPLFA